MYLDQETYEVLTNNASSLWDLMSSKAGAVRAVRLERKRQVQEAANPRKRATAAPCRGCGQAFNRKPKGWLRSFCSDRCRVKFHNTKPKAERPSECEHCRKKIEQDPKSRVRHFCNEACSKKFKRTHS